MPAAGARIRPEAECARAERLLWWIIGERMFPLIVACALLCVTTVKQIGINSAKHRSIGGIKVEGAYK